MKTHKNLEVWTKSIDFITKLYKITTQFPVNEQYGITGQIRRAAVSVPTNIAEGAARNHRKEYVQFITISLGSASELETLLMISRNLNYINAELYLDLTNELSIIMKMLINLKRALS
jgi:four helix bundle protein